MQDTSIARLVVAVGVAAFARTNHCSRRLGKLAIGAVARRRERHP
jgi:hypothetical protein